MGTLIGLKAAAQSDSLRGNQYFLRGTIINKVGLPTACGIIAWATVVELKVIWYSDTAYKQNEVAVIFTCPELYGRDFFKKGKTYDIKVADTNQADFGWSIINPDVLGKYNLKNKLWVITAKRIAESGFDKSNSILKLPDQNE